MYVRITSFALVICFQAASAALGRGYHFATPQVAEGVVSSTFSGINNSGQVVGFYEQDALQTTSFLLTGEEVTEVSVPGARTTFALGVNDAGSIVGSFLTPGFEVRPFLINEGREPEELAIGGEEVWASDVSQSGVVVGFSTTDDTSVAFLFNSNNEVFTTYEHPLADGETIFSGINNHGQVAGSFRDASGRYSGLFAPPRLGGNPDAPVETIDLPLTRDTQIRSSNAAGQLVGYYTTPLSDLPPRAQGFVVSMNPTAGLDELGPSLTLETVNFPGSTQTIINDVNDAGVLVGEYFDAEGFGPFGFVATPFSDLPGDVDFDGDVDLMDFNILKENFGTSAIGVAGDVNGDFAVTQLDVDLIRGAAQTVPEPAAGGMLLAFSVLVVASHRRRGLSA